MDSVQTKESSPALAALTKHKSRGNKPQNMAVQPVAVMVEAPKIELAATLTSVPEPTPATPVVNPQPKPNTDDRDYKASWIELKKYHDTEIHKAREAEKLLREENERLKNAPKVTIPTTPEEIAEFRKQNPKAVDILTTLAIEAASETNKELQRKIEENNRYTNELKEKEAFKELLNIHPDAMEIRSSQQFLTWYNEQPLAIQDILAKSTDIKAVAKQLTLYKLEVLGINPKEAKKVEAQRAVEASMGVEVKTKTEITAQKKIWTKTEIDQICAHYPTYLKYAKELDEARREGRVDMTK